MTTSTASASRLTAQASSTFKNSFERFENTVLAQSKSDHRDFSSTTLQDVRQAAKEIEQQLAARQCLRNMRRIEPFLNGLEAYSKVIEVLCNGTDYLPWIWLAKDHISAFEKLISAYGRIAENMPRFDQLSHAYRHQPGFQQVLAVVYSDILEFHCQAYKFFNRHGWSCFFKSAWGGFDARFSCILDSLSRHSDLVDREANAFLIAETMRWREEASHTATRTEKERLATQLTAALAWLNLDSIPHCGQSQQDNHLDKLTRDCCAGTTEWVLRNPKIKACINDGRDQYTLWLKGKPGSGKSTLCAQIVQFLNINKRSTTLSCFCSYRISEARVPPSAFIFATLISQILSRNRDLVGYVYEEFVAEGHSPSTQILKTVLSNLLPQLESPHIVIDGIDECLPYNASGTSQDLGVVSNLLNDILQIETFSNGVISPKLLLASRDIGQVSGKLSRKPTVFLDNQPEIMQASIRYFVSSRLSEIRTKFDDIAGIDGILSAIKETIVTKSQGLYARIMERVHILNPVSKTRVTRILEWMLSSRRPLRTIELQDAIVFSGNNMTLDKRSKLPVSIIDLCKPLITVVDDGTVVFVHFTVQE
ncbi:hypothetical protein P280DRAFT_395523 [Massarina eburnea CBS 473.64]|uniref:Uncharacterized protein n=1 Tax=Massarina eburnea CBS 473.64 TaxID=1395130 RepID=A0A6A6S4V8_9PLEO|nr:hypothetical protein P280DRAFT_395523 [Massarina eburnea CBS 473.64]